MAFDQMCLLEVIIMSIEGSGGIFLYILEIFCPHESLKLIMS